MKRILLAASAATILLAAAAIPASAQLNGARGSAGAGAAQHSGPAARGGGVRSGGGGGGGRAAIRSGGGGGGGQFRSNPGVQFRGNSGATAQFRGQFHGRPVISHRRHVRAPAVAFGFGGPAYYEYAEPTYSYDDGCYQVRRVQTEDGWRNVRVNVCGDDEDDD